MNQVLIGDLSSQFFMHHRFLEPTFQFRHDKFGGIFFQMKKIQFFRKTVFRDLIPIQQGKISRSPISGLNTSARSRLKENLLSPGSCR